MRIESLHFDVFGTVVDWRESIAREAARILSGQDVECDWRAFADAWRSRYRPALEEVRSGRRGWIKLDDLHRENLEAVVDEFGMSGLGAGDLDRLNLAWHRLDPWPDAAAGLARLKRGYVLATLSNGNVSLMVDLARHGGLPWDAVLGAEVSRAYKPSPEAYLRNAELLGMEPGQCLMVAAHEDDLIAAGEVGFRTAFVHRRSEYGPGQGSGIDPVRDHDVIAEDFLDLADKLGC